MHFTKIETALIELLSKGAIRGTAHVGYALWPERKMQPQGAALAAGKILRGLRDRGAVESHYESKLSRYEVTAAGLEALAEDVRELADERQLNLLE